MGLCHSTVGFTEARANYLPVNKKKMGKLSIWGDITAFEWAWTKKKITKNPEKENKNMGDRKNSGYKQVLQRKLWNCVWENLVEMLRWSGLCLFMAFKVLTKQEEFHMKSKCHEINKMNLDQSFWQLFKLHFFVTVHFSHLFYSKCNVKLMEH